MTRTRSIGTPKAVAATCAITASAPWPCSVTPVWQMIAPCASSLMVTPSWAEIFAPLSQNAALGLVTSMKEANPMPRWMPCARALPSARSPA